MLGGILVEYPHMLETSLSSIHMLRCILAEYPHVRDILVEYPHVKGQTCTIDCPADVGTPLVMYVLL
jgi:hypothetical protein